MVAEGFDIPSTTGADAGPHATGAGPGPVKTRLGTTLEAIRDGLGYETASLFVPTEAPGHWYLAARDGPIRPWHIVLDPGLIETLADDAVYPNARSMPGIGLRLSGLGCGSVAVFSVPGGSRLVLDCAFPRTEAAGIRPDASLLAMLEEQAEVPAEATVPAASDDLALVTRVADAFRRVLEVPGSALGDLLAAVRTILHADEVLVLAEDDAGTIEIHQPPDTGPAMDAPSTLGAILRNLPAADEPQPEAVRRIATALGIGGEPMAAVTQVGGREVLVAAWAHAPRVGSETFRTIGRLIGGARAAFDVRSQALEKHLAPERARWAHDIHDGITQSVTSAVIALENLRGTITEDPDRADDAIEAVQEEIRRSLVELRQVMSDLSDTGEPPHRNRPFEDLIEDIVQRWRLPARISVEGEVQDVAPNVSNAALLVIREALTNAAKHSAANHVTVRVFAHPEGLTVVVRDTGRGFDPQLVERAATHHFGLGLMRQRVAELGGTIEISSTPGSGTKVIAFLPVGRDDAPPREA